MVSSSSGLLHGRVRRVSARRRLLVSVVLGALAASLLVATGPVAAEEAPSQSSLDRWMTPLSSFTPTAATNGWGPWEHNRSNGEHLEGDGGPLTIGGKTYASGFGVHASSSLTFALPVDCSVFGSYVGVDDETGDRGSVVFEVWADGVKLWSSPVLRGTDPAYPIALGLGGARELRLVVTGGGDDLGWDHADWADPALRCSSTSNDLSSVSPTATTNGWGPWEHNRSNGERLAGDGAPLTIGGRTFPFGFGVHASSSLTFPVPVGCSGFRALVGVDDETGDGGSVVFEVWGEGRKLWSSPVLRGADPANPVLVELDGARELRLVVTDGGDGRNWDHADWAQPVLLCSGPGVDLSTVSPTAATNGWGPWERNRSNGERLAGDGGPLTIGGRTFTFGFGVHAASSLTFPVPAGCSGFEAFVGVDDETGDGGSVAFEVWGDGLKLWSSPVLRGTGPAVPVAVGLGGARELRLVVTDGGDDRSWDHGDWAHPRLRCSG